MNNNPHNPSDVNNHNNPNRRGVLGGLGEVYTELRDTNDKLVLKAGSYAGKVLDKAGVQALAAIPSREELLAKLLGVMQAPVSGFAGLLAALAKKREEEAAA